MTAVRGATAASSRRSFRSPVWHRMARQRPRLRPGVEMDRQTFRGLLWYIVRDPLSNRVHRFSAGAREVAIRMDGNRTLDEIWEMAVDVLGDAAPTQDETLRLVGQLYSFDLVLMRGSIDLSEFSERGASAQRTALVQKYQNPLFLRVPLGDPDRFLNATVHLVRPFFGPLGLILWTTIVAWFVLRVIFYWNQLVGNASDRILAPDNLMLLIVIFPFLKIIHELGHGFATKVFGEPVREFGVMLLVFVPTLYVDASASTMLRSKWRRIVVGGAGMMVELLIAAIAMEVWVASEPGLLRAAAFNIIVLASISALVFNGNPLLRFDAYYMFSDLIEIPNLGTRANRFYMALIQRRAFGLDRSSPSSATLGERIWFAFFAPASLAYRLVMMTSIAFFIATHYFVVGVLLALLTVVQSVVWPLLKGLKYLLTSPHLGRNRLRAMASTTGSLAVVLAVLFIVPLPYATVVHGVVWVPDAATIVAEADGQVIDYVGDSDRTVAPGDTLLRLDDPFATDLLALSKGKLAELQQRLRQAEIKSVADGQILHKQLDLARDEVAEATARVDALDMKARTSGRFIVTATYDLMGAQLRKGDLIGVVIGGEAPIVRAAVPEDSVSIIRERTRTIDIRLSHDVVQPIGAVEILREIPGATRRLPSPALADAAGGPFAVDPTKKDAEMVLPVFLIDLKAPLGATAGRVGERAWIRFGYDAEPVGFRLWRAARQTFLSRLHV